MKFRLFDWLRRRGALPSIPDAAWAGVLRRYPFLESGAAGHMAQLRALAAAFLQKKEFHGAHGFVITDEVALAIAAQAVLPLLHLEGGLAWYDDFVGIVVHAGEVVARRSVVDAAGVVHEYEEVVAGEAMAHGPVMLSWQDVLASSVSGAKGYNLVLHEFAHKLDMKDGAADGCPPLPSGFADSHSASAARAAWFEVLHRAFELFREQTVRADRFGAEAPWLDAYGAESIAEFFAVACEGYFVNRAQFSDDWPQLLALFDAFFGRSGSMTH